MSALIAVGLFLFALNFVRSGLLDSSDKTSAALLSFRVHEELGRSLDILSSRAEESIDNRSPSERAALRQSLLSPNLPVASLDFSVPLSLKDAAALQATYDSLVIDARSLAQSSGQAGTIRLAEEIETLQTPLNLYLSDPSGRNFRNLYFAVSVVEEHARAAIPNLVGEANDEDSSLQGSVRTVGFGALAVLVGFAGFLIALTNSLSQRVRQMYTAAERERIELRVTTEGLQHRNEQMAALYTVFTEITDTLSLRYVVAATLREALKLMNCHTAVLRLLKDGQLTVAGSLTREGSQLQNELPPTPLGEDTVGRVAKRGRPIRIGDNNQELMTEGQRVAGMRSGLIIPLIIGARVVGTLSVWSQLPNAFSDEDERILGMMGSQVATAVVAADTTEASERRAHHDPLTGLPNRLHLSNDIAGEFATLQMDNREAVIAMVDIDHFKRFNDDFGHAVGDVSLQKVASTLRTAIREQDRVYRYGGEEFVIIFVDAPADQAFALADRVRSAIEATPLTGEQLEPVGPITISMGLASFPDDGREFGSLLEMADLAMYRAKAMGRNQIATWSKDILSPKQPEIAA